jgi:TolB-like protein
MLTVLVTRAGELVERDELRERLWPSDTYVDFDLGLNHCATRLRALLGDQARAGQYIETVPKRGYRFVAPVEAVQRHARPPVVAVLPFENLNASIEEYISPSLVDLLVETLAREPDLRVVCRHSMPRDDRRPSLTDLSRTLGVDAVVEGSVLCLGGRCRISARLVRLNPERYLWVDWHEGEMSDALGILSELARRFAAGIRAALVDQPVNSSVLHSH